MRDESRRKLSKPRMNQVHNGVCIYSNSASFTLKFPNREKFTSRKLPSEELARLQQVTHEVIWPSVINTRSDRSSSNRENSLAHSKEEAGADLPPTRCSRSRLSGSPRATNHSHVRDGIRTEETYILGTFSHPTFEGYICIYMRSRMTCNVGPIYKVVLSQF